jgi:hypothetical protein
MKFIAQYSPESVSPKFWDLNASGRQIRPEATAIVKDTYWFSSRFTRINCVIRKFMKMVPRSNAIIDNETLKYFFPQN